MRPGDVIKLLSVLFLFVMLPACAGMQTHIPMEKKAKKNVDSTEIYVCLKQQEIYAEIRKSNLSAAAMGGLIPALIDVAINRYSTNKAETRIKPIRDALTDYDLPLLLNEHFNSQLSHVDWLHIAGIETVFFTKQTDIEEVLRRAGSSNVLLINPDYHLSEDFRSLVISCSVSMYPGTTVFQRDDKPSPIKLTDDINCLFRDTYNFEESFPENITTDEAIKLWMLDDAKRLKEAVNKGAKRVGKKIAMSLQE